MSTTSTTPENASSSAGMSREDDKPPADLGDAFEVVLDGGSSLATIASTTHHDKDSLSTILPPSTNTTFAPAAPSAPPYLAWKAAVLTGYNHLQLSERDSIFATSYTANDSDAPTPRSYQSRDDPSQDVATDFRLPPAIVSRRPGSRRGSLMSNLNAKLKIRSASIEQMVNGNKQEAKEREQTRSVKQDIPSTGQRSTSPRLPTRSPNTYQLQMSPSQWQQPAPAQRRLEFTESPLDNVSQSDEVRPRHEQRIEAVLTDEPVPHGRSRKASHYLGIFKEKGNVQDSGKSSKGQSTEFDLDTQPDHLGTTESSDAPEQKSSEILGQLTAEQVVASLTDADRPFAPSAADEPSSQATSPLVSLFSHRSNSTEIEDENISNLGDSVEWRSADTGYGGLPIRLLEDIRNRRGRGKLHPLGSDLKKAKTATTVTQLQQSNADQDVKEEVESTSNSKADADDETEDSDKEHIASATYYPHQAPSPDTTARGKILTEEEVRQTDPDLGPPAQIVSIDSSTVQGPQGSANSVWKLQSKDKAQQFEQEYFGDRRKSRQSPERSRWSFVSIPSDTEYESGYDTGRSEKDYDSGVTDGGDLTPTATSHITSAFHGRKLKKPLKAVELKPYQHQVGGHTKVFSFSKQAICKQLNNRENVFYEVVERRHPELLAFLPKYLGVLNVTYKKIPKQKKGGGSKPLADVEPDKHPKMKALESSGSSPHTRMISHSLGFDKLEEAIPQVVYANNMHIIPDNLFKSRIVVENGIRPATSDGVPENILSKIQSNPDEVSGPRKRSRPSIAKSMSTWGATMINTQFKEKVLREVFNPPQIHHRQRGRRLRSRNEFQRLREQAGKYSSFEETSDVAVFSPRGSMDGAESSASSETLLSPARIILDKEGIKAGSAPHTNGKSMSRLASIASQESSSPGDKPQRARSIRRRRSGGGLRRKQDETVDGQRGEFEYYEEADVQPDKDDLFAMELLSQTTPDLRVLDSSENNISSGFDKPNESSIAGATPTIPPNNPMEAQLSPDGRAEHFLLLEDLTAGMLRPCVLDLKMGTRQYGIDASKKKQQSQRQKCKSTTSLQLGVRLCGMQVWNARESRYVFEDKYAGRDIHAGREFQDALRRFLSDGVSDASTLRHIPPLLDKLSKLEKIIVNLPGYRFYASSLLVLYDGGDRSEERIESKSVSSSRSASKDRDESPLSSIDIRLVDFANCVTGEDKLPEDSACPPKNRDGVDGGYIRGLKSLRRYLRGIWRDLSEEHRAERGEIEKREDGGWRDEWNIDDGEASV